MKWMILLLFAMEAHAGQPTQDYRCKIECNKKPEIFMAPFQYGKGGNCGARFPGYGQVLGIAVEVAYADTIGRGDCYMLTIKILARNSKYQPAEKKQLLLSFSDQTPDVDFWNEDFRVRCELVNRK